jgi:hypothetical protein
LPSGLGETHGKEFVAEQYIAVRSLPCVGAWQRLCRAVFPLCRAFCPHGKALFSGSEVTPIDLCPIPIFFFLPHLAVRPTARPPWWIDSSSNL